MNNENELLQTDILSYLDQHEQKRKENDRVQRLPYETNR